MASSRLPNFQLRTIVVGLQLFKSIPELLSIVAYEVSRGFLFYSFLSFFLFLFLSFFSLPSHFFPSAPGAPILIPEECSAENNSVTVAWQPPPGHGIVGCAGQRGPAIEGYLLELDDGCGGEFRVNE